MDLSQFDTSREGLTSDLVLLHPTKGTPLADEDGKQVVITLLGSDSKEFRAAAHAVANKRLSRKGRRQQRATAEEVEQAAIETLAAITAGWSNLVVDGETLPCNKKNVISVYNRFPWILEQVEEHVHDRENFLGN